MKRLVAAIVLLLLAISAGIRGEGRPEKLTFSDVAFTHGRHAERAGRCAACHPKIFKMKLRAEAMTMAPMYGGRYCGACHDGRRAFGLSDCRACHAKLAKPASVTWSGSPLGGVTFSHAGHLSRTRVTCKSCHTKLFPMKAHATPVKMRDLAAGRACGACHDGGGAFGLDRCSACHAGVGKWGGRAGDGVLGYGAGASGRVTFSHRRHGRFDCASCHDRLFRMKKGSTRLDMERLARGGGCGACHDGRAAFGLQWCARCHEGKDMEKFNYSGGALGIVAFSHGGHFRRAGDCASCHDRIFKRSRSGNDLSMERMGQGKGCGACHNGVKTFPADRCSLCHAGRRGERLRMAEPLAGDVAFTHGDHYRREKSCATCHPKLFAPASGKNAATMRDMDGGKSCGACHDGLRAFRTSDCSLCHDGAKALGGGVITWPGPTMGKVPFSHAGHRDRGMRCQQCHDGIFQRKKGASGVTMDAINDKRFCGACHDGARAFDPSDCAKCHRQE